MRFFLSFFKICDFAGEKNGYIAAMCILKSDFDKIFSRIALN